SERCGKPELISHDSLTIQFLKSMIVLEALERACCHYVLKERRRLVLRDPARMLQHQAEMAAAPGNRFTLADQSCGYASHRLLSCARSAGHVQIDTQREKETSTHRS